MTEWYNHRHYSRERRGTLWYSLCGFLVETRHRSIHMLFTDCERCLALLQTEKDSDMSDIEMLHTSLLAQANSHDDPKGGYARGLRAAADQLKALIPADKAPERPSKAVSAPAPTPEPSEPEPAPEPPKKRWTKKPPKGVL